MADTYEILKCIFFLCAPTEGCSQYSEFFSRNPLADFFLLLIISHSVLKKSSVTNFHKKEIKLNLKVRRSTPFSVQPLQLKLIQLMLNTRIPQPGCYLLKEKF